MKKVVLGLTVSLGFFLMFVFLSKGVVNKEAVSFDRGVSNAIYNSRTPLLTTIMTIITHLGDGVERTVVFLLAILLLVKKHKKLAYIFFLSLIVGEILDYGLKIIFQLPRPDIIPLIIVKGFTYPSGHALTNMILYGLLALCAYCFIKNKLFGILVVFTAVIWTGLIGFSRVYLGAHYPSDVIAGYLIGLWWLVTVWLVNKCRGGQN